MNKEEIKKALKASKNETIASRAEEIINYIFNKDEDDEISFNVSFGQVSIPPKSVRKTYREEHYQSFLDDIETVECMLKLYDKNIGCEESVDDMGIHWTIKLDVTNKDGHTMRQIIDFHIWKFFEKEA